VAERTTHGRDGDRADEQAWSEDDRSDRKERGGYGDRDGAGE
jgi:hypothetical protein